MNNKIFKGIESDILHDGTIAAGEAAESIGVAAVVEDAAGDEVHLQYHARVRRELKLGRGHTGGGEDALELVVREKVVEHRGRCQWGLQQA